MKKPLLFFFFLTLCTLSKAQNWCPNIGTYWYYGNPNNPAFCSPGYAKFDYYKDSLVNGNNCQMIRRFGVSNCSNGFHSGYSSPIFTYTNNNVVYVNYVIGSGSVQSQVFDTLYWFNAPIGSKWQMSNQTYSCSFTFTSVVTVQDTGHSTFQGINLKWQKVNYTTDLYNNSVQTVTDTIYERFGYLRTDPLNPHNFCSNTADIQSSIIFRCYGDNQFTNLKYKYTGDCDYYDNTGPHIGIQEENGKKYAISIFPNPTQGTITLQSETTIAANTLLEIQDHLGKTVWKGAYTNQVDVSKLSPGMYFLTVKDTTAQKTFKIIKE